MSQQRRHEAPTMPAPSARPSKNPRVSGVRAQQPGTPTVPARRRGESDRPVDDIEILVPGTLPLAPQLPRGFVEDAIRPTHRPARRMSKELAAAQRDLPAQPAPPTKKPKDLVPGRVKAVIEVQIYDRRRDPRSEEEE